MSLVSKILSVAWIGRNQPLENHQKHYDFHRQTTIHHVKEANSAEKAGDKRLSELHRNAANAHSAATDAHRDVVDYHKNYDRTKVTMKTSPARARELSKIAHEHSGKVSQHIARNNPNHKVDATPGNKMVKAHRQLDTNPVHDALIHLGFKWLQHKTIHGRIVFENDTKHLRVFVDDDADLVEVFHLLGKDDAKPATLKLSQLQHGNVFYKLKDWLERKTNEKF